MPEFPPSNGDPAAPSRDLPAPYVNPWTLLGRDLRAVLASLVLKARELWRRNRAADLPRPGFWPRGAAPLFWPLVLTGGLVLAVALGRLIRLPAGTSDTAEPTGPPTIVNEGDSGDRAAGSEGSKAPERIPNPVLPDKSPSGQPLPDPAISPQPLPQVPESANGEVAPVAPPEVTPEMAALRVDDPDHLIGETRADPAAGRLELRLSPAFGALSAGERRRWAERWQERAASLGYGDLELRASTGRLLGRNALVGSGMILLEPEGTL